MPLDAFGFPVWVYVNSGNRPSDGYPYYLLIRGGEHTQDSETPIPASVPVFSTKVKAENCDIQPPFVLVEMDAETFREAITECRYAEDIVFDMGSPEAKIYRIEKLLS